MIESKYDSVRISKEAQSTRPTGVAPTWIPPVLKRFYDFTRNMAKKFNGELKVDREEELIKAVSRSFKGDI